MCLWELFYVMVKIGVVFTSLGNLSKPPRSKHCQQCDKCVCFDFIIIAFGSGLASDRTITVDSGGIYVQRLPFACGQAFFIGYLRSNIISRTWWKDGIMILLLCELLIILVFLLLLLLFHSYLILTNQTTYELVRRRRITYLFGGIPERV